MGDCRIGSCQRHGKCMYAPCRKASGAASETRSRFKTLGDNWDNTGRLVLPLAMGPGLSDAAKERLRKMEEMDAVAFFEACRFPLGAQFQYHDEEGEHDPAYVVIPGGEMLPVNGYADGDADVPTDVARAAFIVRACNAALEAAQPSSPPSSLPLGVDQ